MKKSVEKVAIVKCKSYNQKEVDKAIRKLLKLLNFPVNQYKKILIKPNVLGIYDRKSFNNLLKECINLEELEVSGITAIKDESLKIINESCKKLIKLSIGNNSISIPELENYFNQKAKLNQQKLDSKYKVPAPLSVRFRF